MTNVSHIAHYIIRATALLSALTGHHAAIAQSPATIAIRNVTAPSAKSAPMSSFYVLREIVDGKVLINDTDHDTLLLHDSALEHGRPLADAQGAANRYPRFAKLI